MSEELLGVALEAVKQAGRDEVLAQVSRAKERMSWAMGQAKTFGLVDVADTFEHSLKILDSEVKGL